MRLLFILVLGLWGSACWSVPLSSSKYDHQIINASKTYLPGTDWRLYKAQLYQESLLNPEAKSPVGAEGIAQFMPATWLEVSRQIGFSGVSPRDAKFAIQAGAFYMARLRKGWSAPRPDADRHSLAMASYNAGVGNILKAQKVAGGANDYKTIIGSLPNVTGHHSKETIQYVERIWQFYVIQVIR